MSSPRRSSRSRNNKSALELLGATPRGQKRKAPDHTDAKKAEEKQTPGRKQNVKPVDVKKAKITEVTKETPRKSARNENLVEAADNIAKRSRSASANQTREEKPAVQKAGETGGRVEKSCGSSVGRTKSATPAGGQSNKNVKPMKVKNSVEKSVEERVKSKAKPSGRVIRRTNEKGAESKMSQVKETVDTKEKKPQHTAVSSPRRATRSVSSPSDQSRETENKINTIKTKEKLDTTKSIKTTKDLTDERNETKNRLNTGRATRSVTAPPADIKETQKKLDKTETTRSSVGKTEKSPVQIKLKTTKPATSQSNEKSEVQKKLDSPKPAKTTKDQTFHETSPVKIKVNIAKTTTSSSSLGSGKSQLEKHLLGEKLIKSVKIIDKVSSESKKIAKTLVPVEMVTKKSVSMATPAEKAVPEVKKSVPLVTLDESTGLLRIDGKLVEVQDIQVSESGKTIEKHEKDDPQSQKIQKVILKSPEKMKPAGFKEEVTGETQQAPVTDTEMAQGDDETEERVESMALSDGTSRIIKVTHPTPGEEGDGYTEIVIVKMNSKDQQGDVQPFIKPEPETPERRKSVRTIKPTPKRQALDQLKDTCSPVKPKDIMKENVVVIGGKDGRSTMKCKHCDHQITSTDDFHDHMKTHPEVVLKMWQCPVCYYRVSDKETLKTHMETHTAAKQFKCTECGKLFASKPRLTQHMKYHNDVRDQECPLCDKAFHEFKTLQNHLCMIHKTSKMDALKFLSSQHPRNPSRTPIKGVQSADRTTSVTVEQITEDTSIPKISSVLETVNQERRESEDLLPDNTTIAIQVSDATQAELEGAIQNAGLAQSNSAENGTSQADKPESMTVYDMNTGSIVTEEIVEAPTVTVAHEGEEQSDTVKIQQDNGVGDLQDEVIVPESSRSSLFGTIKTQAQTKLYKELTSKGEDTEEQVKKKELPVFKVKDNEGMIRIKPDGGIAIGKKGRWINNQRYTKRDEISQDILEFADIEEGDCGVKIIFRCKMCESSLPSKSQFQTHMEQQHPELKPWKCDQCDYKTRMRTSLIIHKKIHIGDKKYVCCYCSKRFLFKQKLTNHMKHHENLREHKCPLCGRGFNEKSDMSKHLKRVHMNIRPHECEICKKSYKEPVQLRNHMETHAGIKQNQCEVCHKFYLTRKSLLQHMKCHTCMFHCEICNKSFGSYSGFMAHKVMHDESYGGYRCDICMKILHTKGSLHRHKTVAHNDDRPYQCRACSKAFKTKKDLKNHLVVHSEDKEYQCTLCSYQAKRPENLKVHMRRHNEIKPYQCGICGRDYTQRMALERHLLHHATTRTTMFTTKKMQCQICQMCFFHQKTYDEHMEQEHQVTPKQKELIEEVVVTSGEQEERDASISMTVFLCEECNSVFTSQDELAGHILASHMKQPSIKTEPHAPGVDSEVTIPASVPSIQRVIITDEYGIKVPNTSKQDVGTVVSIPENDMMSLSQDQLVSLISQDATSSPPGDIIENQVVEVESVINDGQIPSDSVLNINHINQAEGAQIPVQTVPDTAVSHDSIGNQNLETLLAVAESMQIPDSDYTKNLTTRQQDKPTKEMMVKSEEMEVETMVTTNGLETVQAHVVEVNMNTGSETGTTEIILEEEVISEESDLMLKDETNEVQSEPGQQHETAGRSPNQENQKAEISDPTSNEENQQMEASGHTLNQENQQMEASGHPSNHEIPELEAPGHTPDEGNVHKETRSHTSDHEKSEN